MNGLESLVSLHSLNYLCTWANLYHTCGMNNLIMWSYSKNSEKSIFELTSFLSITIYDKHHSEDQWWCLPDMNGTQRSTNCWNLPTWLGKQMLLLIGQYHACWCPGHARSQGIIRINIGSLNRISQASCGKNKLHNHCDTISYDTFSKFSYCPSTIHVLYFSYLSCCLQIINIWMMI